MRNLNKKRISCIISEIEKGRKITEIAQIHEIFRVQVCELPRQYLSEGEMPKLKKTGRKKAEITQEERELTLEMQKA